MMMTIEATKLSLLMDIAARAIEAEDRECTRRGEDDALGAAYYEWREKNGIDPAFFIKTDSEEWRQMTAATSAEYEVLVRAKKLESNAKRRLKTAIRKYRDAVYAERRTAAGLDPINS